jgi:hypothetical protein
MDQSFVLIHTVDNRRILIGLDQIALVEVMPGMLKLSLSGSQSIDVEGPAARELLALLEARTILTNGQSLPSGLISV